MGKYYCHKCDHYFCHHWVLCYEDPEHDGELMCENCFEKYLEENSLTEEDYERNILFKK